MLIAYSRFFQELDRRNALLAAESSEEVCKLEPQSLTRDIETIARHGGIDLSDLRRVRSLPFDGEKSHIHSISIVSEPPQCRIECYQEGEGYFRAATIQMILRREEGRRPSHRNLLKHSSTTEFPLSTVAIELPVTRSGI